MDRQSFDGYTSVLAEYETPFADTTMREADQSAEAEHYHTDQYSPEYESPFAMTFEAPLVGQMTVSPVAGEIVNLLGELQSEEFEEQLYEMAQELEDTWSSKVSNETAMGDRFVPYATQEAHQYFEALLQESNRMFDRASSQFSGNNFEDLTDAEIENFFETYEWESTLSPAQEQFFGGILKKVKSVVKKGIDLAKKGVAAVGKILPIGMILNKLKGLIKPLLDKVLKFAIGKLPANLQPYARTLAGKLLNMAGMAAKETEDEIPAAAQLESLQAEFDVQMANLLFAPGEAEAEDFVMEYESSIDTMQREDPAAEAGIPALDAARQRFISELQELQPGQSPAPAIERFIPAAIMALQPVIKIALNIIGRQKVINFLAGLLAKLVAKYVPEQVAKPLAASIIDVGMSAIGFETAERNRSDLAYEAIANTVQETIQNLGMLSEETLNDQEALTAETLEAFEQAAANNFPQQHLKAHKRLTQDNGAWVMMPRYGHKHCYKKYARVFDVTLDHRITSTLRTFRGLPLSHYLRDKLGMDPAKPVQARVHIYEAIPGTKLYHIAKFEKVPGLRGSGRFAYRQLHPLTVQAATALLREPRLGRDFRVPFTTVRHRIAVGQRFYFLEIAGAKLRVVPVATRPQGARATAAGAGKGVPSQPHTGGLAPRVPNSSDVQGVINFVRSEIRFNYYFSEQDALTVAEKLNAKDYAGAFISIRYSIRTVLQNLLIKNVGSKVKIIHETMPEMYLENYTVTQDQFSLASIGSAVGGLALNAGKELLQKLVEKLVTVIADAAYNAVLNYFKAREKEFLAAQASPMDGVTVKIIWFNVPGMAAISAIINAIKGRLSVGNIADLVLPSLPAPEVKISAGKHFD
ncbi:MAG: hypothetical protein HY962_08215 [Ignavibacteriae bacterium]|nr:hypothetical protein [Ignavibacteriota bacterium]